MSKRWTMRRGLLALLLLAVAAIGATLGLRAVKGGHAAPAPAPVTLEFVATDLVRVESRPLARWLAVSGTVQPVSQATVKAKVSGDVREIRVREGDAVRPGQVLARVDTADLEAKLAERIGALESTRAQLALAEKTRRTNRTLLQQSFISRNAFDSSESSYTVARGGEKSAEAQVQLARNALRDAVVVAPIGGIVAKRHVQPGEKVAFDTPILTIVDLRALELQAMVPAADVPELAIGMTVELIIDGFDRRFHGRVERINPATEAGTRAILVYVGIPNPDQALRGGMFATGRIALAADARVPTVPITAVREDAGQAYVWTIESGKLARRAVTLGRRDEESGMVEVKSALPAGVPVLAARFDNLKEGAPAVVRAPSAPAKAA